VFISARSATEQVPFKPVVLNAGKSPIGGRFYALWGCFCDLRDLGGRFRFPGGDFCRLKHNENIELVKKTIFVAL